MSERKPYPDCAAKDRPHPPHQLAGPGGNKPGAYCDGLSEEDEDES